MNKIVILTIAFLSQLSYINANTVSPGSWLMVKTIENNTVKEAYTLIDFLKNGHVKMMEIDAGRWRYDAKNHTFEIADSPFKKLNGTRKVIVLTPQKIVLEKEGVQWVFKKINIEKIKKENLNSGLIGAWKFTDDNNDDSSRSITFKTPDSFTILEKGKGYKSTINGTWIYNKKGSYLIIISLGNAVNIRGKNNVLKIDKNQMIIQNKGIVFKGKRIVQNAKDIKRLHFTEDDFYDKNGDYKYDGEEEKLPWQDSYALIENLQKVTQLVYTYKVLIKSTQSFDTKILKADVTTNKEGESVRVDYIFYGYDNSNLPDDTKLPPNNFDPYTKLFPYKGDTFRVTGSEKITTPAGTFNCTTVETINTSEEKSKLWMANDNPGIIVKIIQDNPGRFGYYHIYELNEIK